MENIPISNISHGVRHERVLSKITWFESSAPISINILKFIFRGRNHNWIFLEQNIKERSNHQRCSIKQGVLRNFTKFTGKELCQSLFINKVAEACNFIKKETLAQVFCSEFCEIFKNTFFNRAHLDDCFWTYLLKLFCPRVTTEKTALIYFHLL